MKWEYLRCEEFNDAVKASGRVCVIPIGCVEAHGVHLPLGCDTIKGYEFAARASEKETVTVFPAMYFGEKSGAGEFPGTIIFPNELIWQILEHSCTEIARNGFKKIVIISAHGGNSATLSAFCRNMLNKKPNFIIFNYYMKMPRPAEILAEIENYPYLTEEDIALLQEFTDKKLSDGHGGFIETSCLYDVCPEYIRLDRMDALDSTSCKRFDAFSEFGLSTPFAWMGNYPNSYSADPFYHVNERFARAFGEKTVNDMAKMFKFVKEETISDTYLEEWLAKQK